MAEGLVIDIEKALGGPFVDEGYHRAGKRVRRISVQLPIAKEEGFNCHRALVHLAPENEGLFRVARIERFRAMCICCGEGRMEEVARMDDAAEQRLLEYLEEARG